MSIEQFSNDNEPGPDGLSADIRRYVEVEVAKRNTLNEAMLPIPGLRVMTMVVANQFMGESKSLPPALNTGARGYLEAVFAVLDKAEDPARHPNNFPPDSPAARIEQIRYTEKGLQAPGLSANGTPLEVAPATVNAGTILQTAKEMCVDNVAPGQDRDALPYFSLESSGQKWIDSQLAALFQTLQG